jgi:polysaccharide pyruvyl transferase WcaK-like protein
MTSPRICFYGNFGAGNLGNEATLQAIIVQIRRRWPDARLLCFCTDPDDVRARHEIDASPAHAVDRTAASPSAPRGGLARIFRIAFKKIPLEIVHWIQCLQALRGADMFVVAGTGIVCDYLTGPRGYPYEIFKLSALAALCRVKVAFLSVGVGPIHHPLSRRLIKRSLALADHRSYRDEASKRYVEGIGFDAANDPVCPDVVFGLARRPHASHGASGATRIIGLGIKDFGSADPEAARAYLDTMADFVSKVQARGYGVRLLIGDIHYDSSVIEDFVRVLQARKIPTDAPRLIVEPAPTVEELLRQIGETQSVISARYHNLVMALIQSKPVIALSDHAKLDSVVTEFGLAHYLLPLKTLSSDDLLDRFEQLENDTERLRPLMNARLETYREALDALYANLLTDPHLAIPEASSRSESVVDHLAPAPAPRNT